MQINIKDQSGIQRKPTKGNNNLHTALAAIYVIIASVYISSTLFGNLATYSASLTTLLSAAMPIASLGVCMILAGSPKPILPFCIITGAIMFLGVDLTLSSALCVFIALICVYAFLLHDKAYPIAIVSSVLSFVALLLWQGVACSVISLAYVPVGITLFFVFKKKKQRVPSVVALSICMALIIAALLVVSVYSIQNSWSFEAYKSFFDTFRSGLISSTTEIITSSLEDFPYAVNADELIELFEFAVILTFNLLPAIVTVCLFVVSFVAHSLFISMVSSKLEDKSEITNAITFNMSVTSAVLFMLSYIASLVLAFEGEELYAVVAQNIYTMLCPGFTMITLGFVASILKARPSPLVKALFYVGIFGMLFFMTGITLLLASFTGAILVITFAIKSKLDKLDENQ